LGLIGGGEHARVVAEAATLAGFAVRGALADQVDPPLTRIADDADLPWIIAIGGNAVRWRIAQTARRWATIVHPRAWISPSAVLGAGVFVGPGALVHAGARVGDHAIINSGAIVEHDAILGCACHIAPGAVLGGGVRVGDRAVVALGARVRDHRSIGDDATVGMGAVAVADVPAGATVVGVPARVRA
jgi:acetyltransferase EpsM